MTRGSLFGYEVVSELPLRRLGDGAAPRGTLTLRGAADPVEGGRGPEVHRVEQAGTTFVLERVGRALAAHCSATGSYLIDEISAQSLDGGTPLSGMLLDSDGLNNEWYAPQLIYFWSTDSGRKGLVPDLRYVPRVGLSQESQRTEIVNWVLGGPSDLLENAVANTLYTGITLVGPSLVPPDSNGLLINLSAAPQGLEPQQVMDQLWALGARGTLVTDIVACRL